MSLDSLSTSSCSSSEFFSKSFDGSTRLDVGKERSGPHGKLKKASSMEEEKPQAPATGITRSPFTGSIKRRSIKVCKCFE